MAFFLPSFFQKRILRYALSRLELLDTKDFDLENLDIVWGKRSTVELRNIGVHIEKLSSLLQLPPSLILVKARILLLRITVPADIYNSGISIEVDGLNIALEVRGTENNGGERTKSSHRGFSRGRLQKGVKADRPRDSQSHIHDPGGLDERDEGARLPVQIPTTIDLAKSFLQSEPKEERDQIQTALAQSQHLGRSKTLSESGEDATGFGVGGGISLPGFVAGFLEGVVNRTELSINNVDINLTVELEVPSGDSGPNVSQIPEKVTLQLSIQEVKLEGIPTNTSVDFPNDQGHPQLDESTEQGASNRGLRHILIRNIQGMLISDTSLFPNLSRFSVPPSPNLAHTGSHKKPTTISTAPSDLPSSIDSLGTNRSAFLTESDGDQLETSNASLVSEVEGASTELNCKVAHVRSLSPGQSSNLGNYQFESTVPADSFYSDEGDGQLGGQLYGDQRSIPGSFNADHQSYAEIDEVSRSQSSTQTGPTNQMERLPSLSPVSGQDTGQASPQSERLAQSKLFSHDEAESMYMSAMSQALSQPQPTQSAVPGDGDNTESEHGHTEVSHVVHERNAASRHQLDVRSKYSEGRLNTHAPSTTTYIPLKLSVEQPSNEYISSMPRTADMREKGPMKPDIEPHPALKQGSSITSVVSSDNELVVVKKIFVVDTITLEIPRSSGGEIADLPSPTLSSQYGQSPLIREESLKAGSRASTLGHREPSLDSATSETQPWTAIKVGNVSVLGDISLTKLTILLAQRLTGLLRAEPPSHVAETAKQLRHSRTSIRVKRISWKFLDHVRGIEISGPNMLSRSQRTDSLEDAEVLLKASVIKLKVLIVRDEQSSTSTVSLDKLNFGYAQEDIFSFDSGLKMRDSNRDILAPIDQDIILKITQSPGRRQVELTTLPLHIRFDLRRLDDTFGWFGGFSSILGLGSSMISTVTVTDSKPRKARHTKLTRGVHFENDRHESEMTESLEPSHEKVTARIGGIVFDLVGACSSFRLESTALKVVSRAEGVGLAIDRLNVNGPFIDSKPGEASISAKMAGFRIEYLPTPKDVDLARLLALLSPSKDRYKEDDDDILLETLFRQRRQGGVLRVTAEHADCQILDFGDVQYLPALGEEMKKLSTVVKYLPEDDRPGIMTLLLIRQLQIQVMLNETIGQVNLAAKHTEVAHITLPSLITLGVRKLKIERNASEELVGEAIATSPNEEPPPVIMARFIGNEMEPTIKIKFNNLRVEYHLSTVAAIMGIRDDLAEVTMVDMISSVATLTDKQRIQDSPPTLSAQSSNKSEKSTESSKSLRVDITLHDVTVGLNPRDSLARGLFVLGDTHFVCNLPKNDEASAILDMNRAALMAIDDHKTQIVSNYQAESTTLSSQQSQLQHLSSMGYVTLISISGARTKFDVTSSASTTGKTVEIELRDMLLVLESCADSTQTLQSILNGLQLPQRPITDAKYRTEVVPVENLLASFTGNAFATPGQDEDDLPLELEEGDMVEDDVPQNLEFVSSFYNPNPELLDDSIVDSMLEEDLESLTCPPKTRNIGDKVLLDSFQEQYQVAPDESTLDFHEDHFGTKSIVGGTAHRWNVRKNLYELTDEPKLRASPLRLCVRNIHVIWNLFDGYDWHRTRDTIGQAVAAVEEKAMEQRSRKDRRRSVDVEDEDSVIGDFLFNSIYIGISSNRDPKELGRQVSRNIDDLASETESYATSTTSGSPTQQNRAPRPKGKVRLRRSKYHKLTFELKGASADMVVFPQDSGETQSSIDIRVHDFEIFDHVPTSTWKKFATYMYDAGERESGTSMIHLEILNVKPVPDLAASEIILKV